MSQKILRPTGTPTPGAIGTLTGGNIGKRHHVAGALRNQDRALWGGARVIARVGLLGAGEWQVPSTDPSTQPSQTHPLDSTERTVGVFKVRLTPGYQVSARVMAQPSGAQQVAVGGGAYDLAVIPAGGRVKITVEYDNGVDTETVIAEYTPPLSDEEYYGESSAAWNDIVGPTTMDLRIAASLEDPAELEKWCELDVEATVTVVYIGAVRVMDLCVFEARVAYARDWTDTDYVAHCFSSGNGMGLLSYPSDYPIQRLEESTPDPTCGSLQALSVAVQQQLSLGPVLASWCSWDESVVGVGATSATGWLTSSTSFRDFASNGDATDYDEANPGWSMSSGSNARLFDLSGDIHELRDDDGVVPVRVRIYGSNSGGVGNQATVRVQTSVSSFVDVPITSATTGWFERTGELRCGIGAQDFSQMQIWGKVSSVSYELEVRGFVVEYDGER